MSIESGQYYIITSYGGGFPVGRRSAEDKSLRPKGIYKLPQGTESWEVEHLDNGNYRLKNGGAIVGGTVGHLFAFPIPEEALVANTEWKFEPDVRWADGSAIVITSPQIIGGYGWVVPEQEQDVVPHILLRPLIASPSNPPTYPPNEVFIFKKVDA